MLNVSSSFATNITEADPSSIPLKSINGIAERYRIIADFNQDGILDLALSYNVNFFGNGGGQFTLYLGTDGAKYLNSGKFMAHPSASVIAIEKWNGNSRLWTYLHGGGGIGSLGHYYISEKGLSDFQGITIHPGDSGTKMGNAIIDAIFNHTDVPIEVQRSTTKDNNVVWKRYK